MLNVFIIRLGLEGDDEVKTGPGGRAGGAEEEMEGDV